MRRVPAVAAAALALALVGCGSAEPDEQPDAQPEAGSTPSGAMASSSPTGRPDRPEPPDTTSVDPGDPALDAALSEPVEDSVYPDIGDPGVDALHYDLELSWAPTTDTLTGRETLVLRATEDADELRLDLGETLEVGAATLDGETVEVRHDGKDLVVLAPVEADRRYVLALAYAGTPEPVDAPSLRSDFDGLGLTVDDEHQVWTMQEPYGAFTWYAVNDQPADKALYDFNLSVPSPWTGIANGELVTDEDDGTTRTTGFHLAEPAASYLTTLAFGDYQRTDDTGPHGLPLTYWTPSGERVPDGLRTSPDAVAWLEDKLGPYPFDTGGILLVDSESGMETQTMITLGDSQYSVSPAVVLHEFAHQWYGDQVTPSDWRDVWLNEGMAMYLQLWWESEQAGVTLDAYLHDYVSYERQLRRQSGPPGAYRANDFGAGNIYYGGALFWHSLRITLDDDKTFLGLIRGWPQAQDNLSTDRETLLAYLEDGSGRDLEPLFDAWVEGRRSPALPS